MITAESLTHIPLFARLPENERASLAARAADVRLQRDEWLIGEGQTAAFFAVLDGKVSVVKSIGGQDHELTTFVPGDYFGEVPLLLGSVAVASVRAVEPSRPRVPRSTPGGCSRPRPLDRRPAVRSPPGTCRARRRWR